MLSFSSISEKKISIIVNYLTIKLFAAINKKKKSSHALPVSPIQPMAWCNKHGSFLNYRYHFFHLPLDTLRSDK